MAEDWIKMRLKLRTDPRTLSTAAKLQLHPTQVLGGLFLLWCIGDEHGEFLSNFTRPFLSQTIGIPGFAEALPPEWLQDRNGGLWLPDYNRHNGSTGKSRSLNAKRQQEFRERNAESNAPRNAKPLPEERRGEETINNKPTTKPRKRVVSVADVVIPDDLESHQAAIRQFLNYRTQVKKPVYEPSLEAMFKKMREFGPALPQVIEQSIANGWQGLFALKGEARRPTKHDVSQEFSRG